ncbi:GYF domain-containing protein [Parvularcula dongshanensis]|uniref:GYF domain-containing protein n=1 Tax=Parvularcula dongshanensis TaxID=1173995 RepID=A0A840I3Y5_9PROT|nr:GYF domain-containing protein [Parvularcula dongshanensis]MBB4659032.1 hypothetical protein [Parvularcula dongshanensis]
MLATDNWCIKVAQRVYGPYTQEQMSAFASEGRLSPSSLVAPAGGRTWREARAYPALSAFLERGQTKPFGKSTERKGGVPSEGELSNFVVVFDVASGAAGRLAPILSELGTAFRLTDNVWALATTQSVTGVKNALVTHLQAREAVFVVDCVRGRTVWQNFGPETHSKLTRSWIKS